MEKQDTESRAKEVYHTPLLRKHEPLVDITGVKAYDQKDKDRPE